MIKNEVITPWDIYSEYLESIEGIKFTPREVEVIACMLSGRTAKAISNFLSVTPKTIETHVRNIMMKLECNSRDGIINFIERSDKFSFLKQYYASLLIQADFEKRLQDISKLTSTEHYSSCLIIYWKGREDQTSFAHHLQKHLRLTGIKISVEGRESQKHFIDPIRDKHVHQEDYLLYLVPEELMKELEGRSGSVDSEDSYFSQNIRKLAENVLYLLPERKDATAAQEQFAKVPHIDLQNEGNYYFFVLELLRRILSKLDLQNIIPEFKEKCKAMCGSAQPISSQHPLIEKESERKEEKLGSNVKYLLINKKQYFAAIFLMIGGLSIGFLMNIWNKKEQSAEELTQWQKQEDSTIRSDLVLPAESALLHRPKLITQIENSLDGNGGIQTVALMGPGGAGKTTLARQYAHQQKAKVIWEINAETRESLRSSFEKLAQALAKSEDDQKMLKRLQDIKDPIEREEKVIQFVKEHLRFSNWFLLYDNIEKFTDIQKHFPQDFATWGQGKIILTTRDGNIQNNKHINKAIQIGELAPSQKLNLFSKIMSQGNPHSFSPAQAQEAKTFLEKLPSFPLDVSVAAYYLRAANVTYATYLENINQNNKEFVNVQESLLKEAGYYAQTRYSIITLSLKELINTHKNFADLLLAISLLDSQNIPKDLLNEFYSNTLIDNFIYNLKKYSLITNESHGSTSESSVFSLHRSTQAIILAYLTQVLDLKKDNSRLQYIINTLEKYISNIINKEDISKITLLLGHCEKLLKHDSLFASDIRDSIKGELGSIYFYLSRYKEAEALLHQSIETLERNRKNPEKLGRLLSCLASAYIGLGDIEKGKDYHIKSVSTFQQYFPDNYLKIALHMTYLGNVYRDLGQYEKSKSVLEQANAIFKRKSLENYVGFARNLVDLGKAYRSLGYYEKAKVSLEQGLALYKKFLSKDHFRIAWAAIYLANTYSDLGEYGKAKELIEYAHGIYKKNFSEDHMEIAWILACLGNIYTGLNNYEKAKEFLEQSFKVYKDTSSEDHIEVAWVLACLGRVHLNLKEYSKAEDLFQKSLMIFEKTYGKDHIETARALNGIGLARFGQGHIQAAEDNLHAALGLFQKNNHPDIYMVLEDLAELYFKKSTSAENKQNRELSKKLKIQAANYLKQSLKSANVSFPPDSPHNARIQGKLKNLK